MMLAACIAVPMREGLGQDPARHEPVWFITAVTNVPAYSTESVAPLVFAMILHFAFRAGDQDRVVEAGAGRNLTFTLANSGSTGVHPNAALLAARVVLQASVGVAAMRTRLEGCKGSCALVVTAVLAVACQGGQLAPPSEPEIERASQALTSSVIDRILDFESPTPTDWTVIQNGRGNLSVSTNQSQGFRALTVAARGYVPIQSAALSSLGTRVGSLFHVDVWIPPEAHSISPYYHGAVQLFFSIPSLGVNNDYLGQSELTPLPLGQWLTLNFTPTAQQVSRLSAQYNDLRFTITINSPATDANPYLNYKVDNLRLSDRTQALVMVVDKDGHAIPGANVVAYNGSSATSNTAVSDSTGLASVWVPVGHYRFGVTEAGATYFSATSNQCHVPGLCVAGTIVVKCHGVSCSAKDTCHSAGTCDPSTGQCSDPILPAGTICRAAVDLCDVAEVCTGEDGPCPLDAFASSATVCRPAVGQCDLSERCTGDSTACPAEAFVSAGTVCRGAAGPCDLAEVCSGTDAACPDDGFVAAGSVCRTASEPCDLEEVCSGTNSACPDDGLAPAGTVCRAAVGPCDVAEACSGASSACPNDGLMAAGTVCRPAVGICDVIEACDGASPACPDDTKASDGTACNDNNACTRSDLCKQGVCEGNDPVPCLTLDACHSRACDQATGMCVATQLPDGTLCDDHNACTNGDACLAGVCAGSAGDENCDPSTSSCTPVVVVCAQPSNPCLRSVCEPHSGSCVTIPVDGKVCEDGDPNTQNDICVAGACGGHHAPDGVCGAMPAIEDTMRNDVDYVAEVQKGEIETTSYAFTASADPVANMASTFVTIPVVFHVLDLDGTGPTVTDDEIRDELARINQELSNAFYAELTGYAHAVAGNPRIRFALAQRTPACGVTTGIERRTTTTTDFDICKSSAIQFTAQGGLDAWTNANNPSANPVNYLNIWISPIDRDPEGPNPRDCTAATYGVLTGGVGNGTKDGILSYPRAFRLKSTTNPVPYRGISHEIGHWLALYHPFDAPASVTCAGTDETPGSGNCSKEGDLLCDTPACKMQRTCPEDDPPNPKDPAYVADTCTETPTNHDDLFQNIMGYSGTRITYHACRNMFTADQSLRMQGTLLGSFRKSSSNPSASGMQSLLWSAGLIPPVSGPDIWMADSQADTGDEPNNQSVLLYDTDDIWNRETCDGLLEHQNPKYGSKNCLYIRIRNRGCSDFSGSTSKQLTLYWAKSSTALSWPNPWTGKVNLKGTSVKMGGELGSTTLTTAIPAGQALTYNAEWDPPNPQDYASYGGDKNHFCLLARISGDGSPAKGETSDLASNVKKNKTIVWKNVEVTSDSLEKQAYVTVGPAPSGPMNLKFTELTGENEVSLYNRWGTVDVDLGTSLYAKWVAGGRKGKNVVEKSAGVVTLQAREANLDNLSLAADDYFTVRLMFTPYPDNPQILRQKPEVYRFDVSETSATGALIGGQRVAFKTFVAAGFDHHPSIP